MQYYVVLNGYDLEFQKTKPELSPYYYVKALEEWQLPDSGCFPWQKYNSWVRKVRFLDPISPVSTEKWFYRFKNLESFDKTNLDLSRAITLQRMFAFCHKLQTLDLSGLNTAKVEDMQEVFSYCDHLSDINLSGWDTSNVSNFQSMFDFCCCLTQLDISSFSMESANDISYLVRGCNALKSLSGPQKPAKQSLLANGVFQNCDLIRNIDLSAFGDYSYAANIFARCKSLENIRVSKINCLKNLLKI